MKRKRLSFIISLAMILTTIPINAIGSVYIDMPNNWSRPALEKAVQNGLLKGDNGKIRAEDSLTRAEMATIINRAFNSVKQASLSEFSDVAQNRWYFKDMSKAAQMKSFMGMGDKLNPEQYITREEAFVVLARAFKIHGKDSASLDKFTDKNMISSWAKDELAALVDTGYVLGYKGELNPKGNITRVEFAQIMDSLITKYIIVAGEYTSDINGNVMINKTGVTLKGITITGDLIIGDGVGEGEVILEDTIVTGRLVIRGGGEDSIKIIGNSKINSIIIARIDGKTRVYTEEGVKVGDVAVDGYADVILEGNYGFVTILSSDVTVFATKANIKSPIATGARSKFVFAEKLEPLNDESDRDNGSDRENSNALKQVDLKDIQGVVEPVTGGVPVTTITETDQYTGIVAWAPIDKQFGAGTIYTATITLRPKSGYTLTGIAANFFEISGARATNNVNSGVVTAVFPATEVEVTPDKTIDIAQIPGVTAPVTGATPVTTITQTSQFTGNITWAPSESSFGAGTIYTATIELTPKSGYTLTGVVANFFTVSGATTVTNAANSGVVTAVFPATEPGVVSYFTYTIADDKVTITGLTTAGDIYFNKNVVIPSIIDGKIVTEIGNNAFRNKLLTSVIIPDSLEKIGDEAFRNNYLTSIIIPDSVTLIGGYSFHNNLIETVTIPNSLETIESSTFLSNKLISVIIPDSVKTIESSAFTDNLLTSITIPGSVETIEEHAFSSNLLESIVIPNSVKTIKWAAFRYNKLTSASIPASVTSIGTAAFVGNPDLVITVDGNNPNYMSFDGGLYSKDGKTIFSGTQSVANNMKEGITTIGEYAFWVNGLTTARIPNSVTTIYRFSFLGNGPNGNSHSIILEAGQTIQGIWELIGDSIDWTKRSTGMDSVISIATVPGVVLPVTGANPITTNIESVQYTGTVAWSPKEQPFGASKVYTATITLTPKLGYTLTGVGANFFKVAGAITSNEVNSGVVTAVFPATEVEVTPDKTIDIAQILGVTAPVTGATPVTTITQTSQFTGNITWAPSESPFDAGTVYTATIILTPKTGYTLSGIASNFFEVEGATASNESSSGVIRAIFPETETETEIDMSPYFTFSNVDDEVTILGLTSEGDTYFGTDLIIPSKIGGAKVTRIGAKAFWKKELTSVILPDSLRAIELLAFANNKLSTVIIPNLVETVNDWAFGENLLESVQIGDSVEGIGSSAFWGNLLTEVTIPDSVTFIAEHAFFLNSITTVTIGKSVEYIYPNAFDWGIIINQCQTYEGIWKVLGTPPMMTKLPTNKTDGIITISEIEGVIAPLVGETPVSTIIATEQFTGTVTWNPEDISFLEGKSYTAVICLTAKEGFTFSGLAANFFTVAGGLSYNDRNSSQVIVHFPETGMEVDSVIDIAEIEGVSAPTTGAIPVSEIAATDQYTGTITWNPVTTTFEPETPYTATIILTPKLGYTLTGVSEDFFIVAGATTTSLENSGIVTVIFSKTEAEIDMSVYFYITATEDEATIWGLSPEGVTYFGKEVIIPSSIRGNTVIAIGAEAFKYSPLTAVTIPDTVKTIGFKAFENSELTSISIPTSVTTISGLAFYNNPITSVTIPASVTTIGVSAFGANPNIMIAVDNNNTNYMSYKGGLYTKDGNILLSGTQNVAENMYPGVSIINDFAFFRNNLTSVTLLSSVKTIKEYAFAGNNLLTSVEIPDSVLTIEGWAFYQNQLTSVIIPESMTSIDNFAFFYSGLTSVTIPASVTTIGESTFKDNGMSGDSGSIVLGADQIYQGVWKLNSEAPPMWIKQ